MQQRDVEAVVKRLKHTAEQRDVAAARELRAWLELAKERGTCEEIDTATTYAVLSMSRGSSYAPHTPKLAARSLQPVDAVCIDETRFPHFARRSAELLWKASPRSDACPNDGWMPRPGPSPAVPRRRGGGPSRRSLAPPPFLNGTASRLLS